MYTIFGQSLSLTAKLYKSEPSFSSSFVSGVHYFTTEFRNSLNSKDAISGRRKTIFMILYLLAHFITCERIREFFFQTYSIFT